MASEFFCLIGCCFLLGCPFFVEGKGEGLNWSGFLSHMCVLETWFLSCLNDQLIVMPLGEKIRLRHAVVTPRGCSMKRHGQQV